MIIWKKTPQGVRYYIATQGGRAIWGSKSSAPYLTADKLDMVLRHLRIMEPTARIGAIHPTEKFDEKAMG